MHIASIGIDLGKATFHLVALGERGRVLVRKKFSPPQLLAYTATPPASLMSQGADQRDPPLSVGAQHYLFDTAQSAT